MATLHENYTTGSTGAWLVRGAWWLGQTFTPAISHSISRVRIEIEKYGSPGDLTLSIRATTGGDYAVPTGGDLVSVTRKQECVSTSRGWHNFDFVSPYALTAGVQYAIVLGAPDGNINNRYYWYADGSSPTYAGGHAARSTNSGVTWNYNLDFDNMFEEWEDTEAPPELTTQAVTNIASITATGNGTICSVGNSAVTEHGHCWSTSANPTIADSKTQNGAGVIGAFTSAMTGLVASTLYYVRAYATNSYGTSYGAEVEFTTLASLTFVQTAIIG